MAVNRRVFTVAHILVVLSSCARVVTPAESGLGADGEARTDGGALTTDAVDTRPGCEGTTCGPRQIAPLSTATATSRRPTLRWALAGGTDGARVEVCRDRACALVEATIDAVGTSGAPASDLPTGVHFWRLHGLAAGVVGVATSATWQFSVGARSAPVDTSWGTTLDVNGDGYADVVVGASGAGTPGRNAGRAYVFLGSASGIGPEPTTILTGPDERNGNFGHRVASAGDVNGDGFADVLVGAYGVSNSAGYAHAGRAYVYLGSADGLSNTPATTLTGSDVASAGFGISVASAGDVNGDGFADVVVGADEVASGGTGEAFVYLGSEAGLESTASTILRGSERSDGFGDSVAGAGDLNGDGFADVVVGALRVDDWAGRAYVFLGSASGLGSMPARVLSAPDGPNGWFGRVALADDVNGDGFADLVVGAEHVGAGRAYVYEGNAWGVGSSPATMLLGIDGDWFGVSVASAGDLNGDGFSDVVVGAGAAVNGRGRAYAYLGSASGLTTRAAATLTGSVASGNFGWQVAGAGDVNGDRFADMVVGAPNDGPGRAFMYQGSSAGLVPSPTATLNGFDLNGSFGSSVADGSRESRYDVEMYAERARASEERPFRCSAIRRPSRRSGR